jgi:hypothetical protein
MRFSAVPPLCRYLPGCARPTRGLDKTPSCAPRFRRLVFFASPRWCRVRAYIGSASMACWRRTRSCALQSHRVRQSLQPRPQPLTLRRWARRRALRWARLLKRVFDIDIEHCPNCGASLKIIAAIEDPPVIVKILSHLGLPSRAPAPRAGAALRFIPNDLRSRNRLPTLADGAARSEFERAVRSGTLSAPPTAASPKLAEATPRFSSWKLTRISQLMLPPALGEA